MAKMDELKEEAKDLGIKFSPNISEGKLEEKIEDFYKSNESHVVTEKPSEEEESTDVKVDSGKKTMAQLAKEAEKKAKLTHIVVITDNDQRENNLTSTVPVTCENGYFSLGMKRIPLNVPVELEQGFINVLKEIQIPLAVRNMDGTTSTKLRNRYSISYEDELKEKASGK